MLDIKKLTYLDAVYRHKNFTKASEELYISQPAISTAISSLEKEYKVRLLTRTPKDVTFTPEGEKFMIHVSRILSNCREAQQALADMSEETRNTLRLGISPTLGAEFLPMLYDELFPAWPNARIFIDEGTCQNHIDHLKAGIINLAYNGIPTSIDTDSLGILPVTTSEICVLMHPDHPLSDHETVSIKELESEMLAMLGSSSIMRSLVLREFEKQGCIPNIVSNHEQISCMIQMIHLVPKLVADISTSLWKIAGMNIHPTHIPHSHFRCHTVRKHGIIGDISCSVRHHTISIFNFIITFRTQKVKPPVQSQCVSRIHCTGIQKLAVQWIWFMQRIICIIFRNRKSLF